MAFIPYRYGYWNTTCRSITSLIHLISNIVLTLIFIWQGNLPFMYFFTKTDFYSSYRWPWFFLISIMVWWWLYHKDVKLMVHQLQKVTNEWLLGSSTTRLPCMNDVTLRIKLRIITRTTEQHQQQRKNLEKSKPCLVQSCFWWVWCGILSQQENVFLFQGGG